MKMGTQTMHGAPSPYPQNFSGDVSYPIFLECVPFGVLHKVCNGPSPTELHNKL